MADDSNRITEPPAADESGTAAEDQADKAALGILLVHGIGEQAQGETLTKFAEPIVEWMRDWLARDAAKGSLVASIPTDAALRPPLLAPGTPAHARVVVGTAREDAPDEPLAQEWLFAEAWWGPQVLTPPISSFTFWLVTRGPWLLLFHFNQRLLASASLHNGWKWVIGVPLTVVWVLVSLLLTITLVAASLLALIPIGRVRRAVFTALRRIAGVVGDAYGQLRSPIQRAAFQRATTDALLWLRPRCDKLAVIAHSQGAAIAHGALQTGEAKANLFVTVGAGISKLEALRFLERRGTSDRIAGFLAPLFLVVTAVVALRTRALGLADADTNVLLPLALAIVAIGLLASVWLSVRGALQHLREASQRLSLVQAQPDLRWVDIVGTHDPVPAGELTRFCGVPNLTSYSIPILRSWLADHTSYWTARLSFMELLVSTLADCAELTVLTANKADAAERLAAARRRLKVDLWALGGARWLDLLAIAVPFVVARDRLIRGVERLRGVLAGAAAGASADAPAAPLRFIEDAIANVEQALRWTVLVLAGDSATWARSAINLGIALLLLSLVLLAWRRLEFAIWRAWSAGRNDRALRRPVKLDALPADRRVETRAYAVLSATLANTAMAATLLLALGVSVTWSFAPGLINEAGVYRVLGQTAAGLFGVMLVFSQVAERLKEFVSLRERWRRWRSTRGPITWPSLQAAVSRVVEVAIGLLVAWLIVDLVVDLPAILEPQIIFIGVLALIRALVALLDAVWQRLDHAGASTRSKATLLTLPPALGAAAVAGIFVVPRSEPLAASDIASVLVMVACMAAGMIWLVLRARAWKSHGTKDSKFAKNTKVASP